MKIIEPPSRSVAQRLEAKLAKKRNREFHESFGIAIALGLAIAAFTPFIRTASALAQVNFPDVPPDYWARPFIEGLALQGIVSGYPDNTFRPEKPLDRDEFAALLRDAFSQNEVRQIPSGSVFKDVPKGYWTAPAIEEANEAGFMHGYPGGFFRPDEEVTKTEAIVSLANGLNLFPVNNTTASVNPVPAESINQVSAEQPTTRRSTKKPKFFPLAVTSLMQPLFVAPAYARGTSANGAAVVVPRRQAASPSRPPSFVVSDYYTDAAQIPQYAVDNIAAATKANIVVNYPNLKVLNPSQPLNRGTAAALIYQTLVHQGKLKPIPINVEASKYIVRSTSK